MKIERIELFNFGSYENLNIFDLITQSAEKRIVIIGGKNGAGKTTLFTALQICLYGYASFGYKSAGSRYLKEVYRLINNHARLDESKTAYVKICFSEHGISTDHYEMTRSWTWSNGVITEALSIYQNGELMDDEAVLNFQNYLLHLIPPELHKLYFFDGEKIAEYFLDEAQGNVKDALLILSGNDTYEILYNNVRRILNSKSDPGSFNADQYAQQKELLAQYALKEQEIKIALSEITAKIEQLEADLDHEHENYTQTGGISLNEWKVLQHQIKDEEEHRERLNWELKSTAADVLPFIIVKHLFPSLRDQINTEKKLQSYKILKTSLNAPQFQKLLSSTIKRSSSQDPATDTTLILTAIQSFFENRDLESKKELFRLSEDQGAAILNSIASVEQFKAETFHRYRRRISDSIQKTKELREQLQKSSIENYGEHLQRVSELQTTIERFNYQKIQLQNDLSDLQENLIATEKLIDSSKKALEAELKQKSLMDLSDRMLLLVEELQNQQYLTLISAVEKDLNLKFKQLIRKDNFIDHIYLDHNFTMHLVRNQEVEISALLLTAKKHGSPALKQSLNEIAYNTLLDRLATNDDQLTLALAEYPKASITLPVEVDYSHFSNGEKQVLVMSLYWAIMNQSHNELPFIIDTPFARIDTEHRANITQLFFKELHGQLFVLTTNEELRHEHITALDQQIAKVYMLEYGEDKRTHITEGNYFEVQK